MWTLGSHERRVFCLELGTLLPNCFVLPWNRPSCARLNGTLTRLKRGIEGNMAPQARRQQSEDERMMLGDWRVANSKCAIGAHDKDIFHYYDDTNPCYGLQMGTIRLD